MNLNDYEAVWKRQPLPIGGNADLPTLRATFESKRRKLAATLLVRDLLEAGAGVVVAGILASLWWKAGTDAWPIAFALLLILGVSGFFVRERFRARHARMGAEAPLLAKVEADIAELRHQRRLLLHLWSWYLAPCAVAILIVVGTMVRLALAKLPAATLAALTEHPAALAWTAGYVFLVLPACFWGAWAVNRRAVRKGIEPRLEELEKLQHSLLSGE